MSPLLNRAVLAPSALALALFATPADCGDIVISAYDPLWGKGFAAQNLEIDFDGGLTNEQNGMLLASAIAGLQPGDQLEVGAGTWSIPQILDVTLVGTAANPIRIVAQTGAKPVITRPNASQNVINIGDAAGNPASYLVLRGFEITGGADGIRLFSADHIWIDDCEIHDLNGAGIIASALGMDVDRITATRNEIYATGGSGEGIKLGSPNGDPKASDCIIALNHIHDTGGGQGDGIEIGRDSWGSWIVENEVHDTPYPAVLTYGTGGQPVNLIERNRLYRSGDVVMQVEGDADIFSNLIVDGLIGFYSQQIQNGTSRIKFESNTVINAGRAVSLVNWNDKPGMFFVNNVCYSQNAEAVKWHFGDSGVTIAKNATFGIIAGATNNPDHYEDGAGLSDFEGMAWDASELNARPAQGSILVSNGVSAYAITHGLLFDLNGQRRDTPPDIGCYEKDSWGCHYGYGEPGPAGQVPSIAVNTKPVLGTSNFTFFLKDGPPNEVAFLPWGLIPFQIPQPGGNLWLIPNDILFDFTGLQGSAFFNVPLPSTPGLDGLKIYFQWIISNSASPSGWAYSEGVELTLSAF